MVINQSIKIQMKNKKKLKGTFFLRPKPLEKLNGVDVA